MPTSNKNYVLPIIMMFSLFFIISFVTGLQNPMAIIIKDQFNTSNFMSQLGNFATFIAYACMGVPSGFLLQKIGYKKTILNAIILGFIGITIIYLSGIAGEYGLYGTYAIYLSGAFISGFSMCMLNTVANPMVNTLAGGGKKGNQLIQVGGIFNSTGATIVPIFIGILLGNSAQHTIQNANPALWLALCIFAAAFIVFSFINIPEPHLDLKRNTSNNNKSILSFRHFTLGIIAIFIYVGIEVGIPNMANIYMTSELNINTAVAGTIVGTYWFLMLIGRLIGASIGGFISSRLMLGTTTLTASILIVSAIFVPHSLVNMPIINSDLSFGMAQVPLNILLLILCGLCTSVMWGGIFNLAVEGLGQYTEKAAGIFMTMVCGGGILPLLQSFISDIFGVLNSYYVILFGFIYILFYAIYGSKIKNNNL